MITNVDTTIQALQASSNVLQPGGLISVIAYVGHSGGRSVFLIQGLSFVKCVSFMFDASMIIRNLLLLTF